MELEWGRSKSREVGFEIISPFANISIIPYMLGNTTITSTLTKSGNAFVNLITFRSIYFLLVLHHAPTQ